MNPKEIKDTVREHTASLPVNVDGIIARTQILEAEVARFEIAASLTDAIAILEAGKLPHWQHHPTSEQYQTRNGSDAKYLYLYWRKNRFSLDYHGPKGQRKTYIGAKEAKQDLARYLDTMLLRYEALQDALRENSYQLRRITARLQASALDARDLSLKMAEDVETLTADIPCPWDVDDA